VKFLVDAQLPRRCALWLTSQGHDAAHTLDLPQANRTGDHDIAAISDTQQRIVITKDSDFLDLHYLRGSPQRVLFLSFGNITNARLLELFDQNLAEIEAAFGQSNIVEFSLELVTAWESPHPKR
jgi:predicted nuclease of predicted toxin-antitoxin system